MKYLLVFAIFMLSTAAFARQRDTVFLKKRTREAHAIFIDPNPNSVYYKRIADTAYTGQDQEYKESIRRLKSLQTKAIKPIKITGIPLNWCRLHYYKGKYYVYAPSDWGDIKVSFNDNRYIEMGMERMIYGIESFRKSGQNSYKISTISDYQGKRGSVIIHVIDHKKGIAVFEHLAGADGPFYRYELMIDIKKIKQFPLIVNYTPNHKDLEFIFANPDFKMLLKSVK